MKGVIEMGEIKTDLLPGNLRAAKERKDKKERKEREMRDTYRDAVTSVEPLPESERPRKDGPGGE